MPNRTDPIFFDRVKRVDRANRYKKWKIRAKTDRKGGREWLFTPRANGGTSCVLVHTTELRRKEESLKIALHSRPSCNRPPILTSAPLEYNYLYYISFPRTIGGAAPRSIPIDRRHLWKNAQGRGCVCTAHRHRRDANNKCNNATSRGDGAREPRPRTIFLRQAKNPRTDKRWNDYLPGDACTRGTSQLRT